jgi:hypothetical protein
MKYHGNNLEVRMMDGAPTMRMTDSGVASGLAFLTGELEKRDPKLHEPLTAVTWMRDIVADTGGGWLEYTSNFFVDYATSGSKTSGLIGGETNDIPVMQANVTKDNFKVFSWANILRVPFVGQQFMNQVGRSLDDMLDKGIKLNWNKDIDQIVYEGFPELGVYGLINNTAIFAEYAPYKSGGSAAADRLWKNKSADEILNDVNALINETWIASEFDLSGMANHILIDPVNYAYITTAKVSTAGNVSILNYLLDNNIAKNQGRDIFIAPSRWCTGAGVGTTQRMMAYVNDVDRVRIDLPVTLNRVMTQPVVQQLAYLTAYAGQIGQVKFLYTQCARYMDGI